MVAECDWKMGLQICDAEHRKDAFKMKWKCEGCETQKQGDSGPLKHKTQAQKANGTNVWQSE